jgi:Mimiviridae putative DNA polymerase family X
MSNNKNNEKIIEQFELLKKQIQYDIDFLEKDDRKNRFRLQAIMTVINILKKYNKKITSSKQLENIKGIGDGTLNRIDEILKTGKLKEIKIPKNIEKYLSFIEDLQEIHGIGRKTAYNLFKNYNITSIDDLRKKYEEGGIELPPTLIKGLRYVDKIKDKIPREDIDHLDAILRDTTFEISPKLVGVTCGSYRRGKETSNDIDYIIFHTDLKTKKDVLKYDYLSDFVNKLKKKKIIIEDLTEHGHTKYMGICELNGIPRRIDIRYIPYESYYAALLYFTGSKDTNKKMRQIAKLNDWTLNEYGLFDEKGKMMKVNSEKDIFEYLGMEYLSPEKR